MKLTARAARRRVHLALTLAGTSGIALIFVPFIRGYLPIVDVFPGGFFEPPWWSVMPCMVAPFAISAGYAVWLAYGRLPRWYETICYVLVALFAGLFLVLSIDSGLWEQPLDAIHFVLFVGAFGAAAVFPYRSMHSHRALRSLVSLQAVYLAQMTFWLVLALGEYEIGGWLGVLTCLVYLLQIILVSDRRSWLLLVVLPSILMAGILAYETFS